MKLLKKFEAFLLEGTAKKVTKDKERAKSLMLESERKLNSLKERLSKIGIKKENANDYVEYCYDILMLLVRAKLSIEGYSTGGQGAHEAEVSYLRLIGFEEQDIRFLDKIRYFRNGILYYGTALDQEYAEKVIAFVNKVYPILKSKLIKKI